MTPTGRFARVTGRSARVTGRFARVTGRFARVTGRFARVTGRFAPSPTGALHLGNLRTALVAWLDTRHHGGTFLLRMEDLDRITSSVDHERSQAHDLARLGLDHDGPVVRQSERFALYEDALATLTAAGLTYPCYCTRREIREAAAAPHGEQPLYPGTCRTLSTVQRRRRESDGRPAAIRLLAADAAPISFHDIAAGEWAGPVDDVVLRRNDGVPAYNLAVVVDDHLQGVSVVTRGDDLLPATPSQIHLHRLLGHDIPEHLHVPLVLGPDGNRLAKRHGAVTLTDLAARGVTPPEVLAALAHSLGLSDPGEPVTSADLVDRYSRTALPGAPWTVDPDEPVARWGA